MALESDVPNPDSRLFVQFYSKPMQNAFRTQVEGRPIFEDIVFVKIYVPGDNTTVIDTPARDDHRARFPLHWAHYQNTHGGNLEAGTPLSAWPILSAAQVEELRAIKFFTIESVATASDAQLQRIGMIAGMAPTAFRERAQRYLHAAKDEGFNNQQAERAKKLEEENEQMRADMAQMKEMIAQLAANQKKAPGRKPNQPAGQDDAEEEEAA
jgi:hypothetical protein